MGARVTHRCTCSTCGYRREFLEKSKAKRARNYHKYKADGHNVSVNTAPRDMNDQLLRKLEYWTYDRSYEFERNYKWWMWFYQFR